MSLCRSVVIRVLTPYVCWHIQTLIHSDRDPKYPQSFKLIKHSFDHIWTNDFPRKPYSGRCRHMIY